MLYKPSPAKPLGSLLAKISLEEILSPRTNLPYDPHMFSPCAEKPMGGMTLLHT